MKKMHTQVKIGCEETFCGDDQDEEEGDDDKEDDHNGDDGGHHQAGSSGPCGRDGSCTESRWVDRGRGKTWCDHAGQQHLDDHDVHSDDLDIRVKMLL